MENSLPGEFYLALQGLEGPRGSVELFKRLFFEAGQNAGPCLNVLPLATRLDSAEQTMQIMDLNITGLIKNKHSSFSDTCLAHSLTRPSEKITQDLAY